MRIRPGKAEAFTVVIYSSSKFAYQVIEQIRLRDNLYQILRTFVLGWVITPGVIALLITFVVLVNKYFPIKK